jgi:hypothetical protein
MGIAGDIGGAYAAGAVLAAPELSVHAAIGASALVLLSADAAFAHGRARASGQPTPTALHQGVAPNAGDLTVVGLVAEAVIGASAIEGISGDNLATSRAIPRGVFVGGKRSQRLANAVAAFTSAAAPAAEAVARFTPLGPKMYRAPRAVEAPPVVAELPAAELTPPPPAAAAAGEGAAGAGSGLDRRVRLRLRANSLARELSSSPLTPTMTNGRPLIRSSSWSRSSAPPRRHPCTASLAASSTGPAPPPVSYHPLARPARPPRTPTDK